MSGANIFPSFPVRRTVIMAENGRYDTKEILYELGQPLGA